MKKTFLSLAIAAAAFSAEAQVRVIVAAPARVAPVRRVIVAQPVLRPLRVAPAVAVTPVVVPGRLMLRPVTKAIIVKPAPVLGRRLVAL